MFGKMVVDSDFQGAKGILRHPLTPLPGTETSKKPG